MKDALLLVFANKQDLPGAMKPDELSRRLKLDEIARDHIWKVEPSCATTGEGIFEGLVSAMRSRKGDKLLMRFARHGWATT